MKKKTLDNFVDSWGMMGSLWGIAPSVARVLALLLASDAPISLVEIAEKLNISKGNASMCLKELRNWEVVKLVKEPGDRQDYYVSEEDTWKMFISVTKERKRREFNPLLDVFRTTMEDMDDKSGGAGVAQKRLQGIFELLTQLDIILERSLESERMAHYAISILSKLGRPRKTDK